MRINPFLCHNGRDADKKRAGEGSAAIWHAFRILIDVSARPRVPIIYSGAAHSIQANILKTKNILTMNIKPLGDRVLVKPAPAEEKTVGGIIIPDTAKEKPLQGSVLAVGGGTKDEEMVLKAGDTVLYGKYAGTEVELEGEKYLIMRQSDVLAVLG